MGSLSKSGALKNIVKRARLAKEGTLSSMYTGIDPRTRQGTNKGQTSKPGMSNRRGRGGVSSSKTMGPAKTMLS